MKGAGIRRRAEKSIRLVAEHAAFRAHRYLVYSQHFPAIGHVRHGKPATRTCKILCDGCEQRLSIGGAIRSRQRIIIKVAAPDRCSHAVLAVILG